MEIKLHEDNLTFNMYEMWVPHLQKYFQCRQLLGPRYLGRRDKDGNAP